MPLDKYENQILLLHSTGKVEADILQIFACRLVLYQIRILFEDRRTRTIIWSRGKPSGPVSTA